VCCAFGGIVLAANLVGTYLFALCSGPTTLFSPHIHQVLIALMIWLLLAAESARVNIIIIITYQIGLGGFNPLIAGSTKGLQSVVTGAETWGTFMVQFFFRTLLGNLVGGLSLVAFLGHAQVVAGSDVGSTSARVATTT
jgi:formate/nitrite transporter FocA (FNT family)